MLVILSKNLVKFKIFDFKKMKTYTYSKMEVVILYVYAVNLEILSAHI
jgi:hypothetical protein